MNFPEVIEYTHNGEKYRAEYDGEHDNPDDCFYMVYWKSDMGYWLTYCHQTYKGIQEILDQQTKERQMNTLEKYQADVEAAQKLLERAIKQGEIMSNVKNTVRNLFNKQTKKLPKKFVMDMCYNTYSCQTDGDILTCTLQSDEQTYNYKLSEDDHIIKSFMDDEWVITTIFDDEYESEHDSEPDNTASNNYVTNNPSFDNCYINVGAFAKKHNISLETAHYLIQPWLFSMGHSWGIFMGKSVAHVDKEFLVFEEGRICWEDKKYLEEYNELCLSYSPTDGITYVIVPFVKPKTKRTGWVSVYSHVVNSVAGCIYNTKEEAIKCSGGVSGWVDTVEISWEE